MGLVHVFSKLGGPLAVDNDGHTIAGGEHADVEETPLVRRLIDSDLLVEVTDCPRHPGAPTGDAGDENAPADPATDDAASSPAGQPSSEPAAEGTKPTRGSHSTKAKEQTR